MDRLSASFSEATRPASDRKDCSNSSVTFCMSNESWPFETVSCALNDSTLDRASFLALSTDLTRRFSSSDDSLLCSAENTIVNPSTSPMSSSSLICSSAAADSSSLAMLNETDTERSLPMDERAPNVVPPTPPVTAVPAAMVGMPLLKHDDEDPFYLTRASCEAAGRDGTRLISSFFDYQNRKDLVVRRLILAPQGPTSRRVAGGKRKAERSSRHTDGVVNVGTVFGCSLAIIVPFLEGRRIPGERAHVLRSIRTYLLAPSESVRYMIGADTRFLKLGLKSFRVVQTQRNTMSEMNPDHAIKIDAKYGNVGEVLGVTATLLVVFATMCEVPNHCRHFVYDCSLVKALRCALATLENWKPSIIYIPDEHLNVLHAEQRALQRAILAVREAIEVVSTQNIEPNAAMRMQLEWARIAAFPGGERVDEFTQSRICDKIRTHALFRANAPLADPMLPPRAADLGVLPLSRIPEAALFPPTARSQSLASDTQSCCSSSWHTLSSVASQFSNVSNDSLSGLAASLDTNAHLLS